MLAGKITFLLSTIITYSTYFLISPILVVNPFYNFTLCHYMFWSKASNQLTKDTWVFNLSLIVKYTSWNAEVWRLYSVLCEKLCARRALVFCLKLWSNQLLFATMDVASHIISFESCLRCHSNNLPFFYDNTLPRTHMPTARTHTRIVHINFNQWRRRRGGTWIAHTHLMCLYWQRQIERNTRYIQLLYDVWMFWYVIFRNCFLLRASVWIT